MSYQWCHVLVLLCEFGRCIPSFTILNSQSLRTCAALHAYCAHTGCTCHGPIRRRIPTQVPSFESSRHAWPDCVCACYPIVRAAVTCFCADSLFIRFGSMKEERPRFQVDYHHMPYQWYHVLVLLCEFGRRSSSLTIFNSRSRRQNTIFPRYAPKEEWPRFSVDYQHMSYQWCHVLVLLCEFGRCISLFTMPESHATDSFSSRS